MKTLVFATASLAASLSLAAPAAADGDAATEIPAAVTCRASDPGAQIEYRLWISPATRAFRFDIEHVGAFAFNHAHLGKARMGAGGGDVYDAELTVLAYDYLAPGTTELSGMPVMARDPWTYAVEV